MRYEKPRGWSNSDELGARANGASMADMNVTDPYYSSEQFGLAESDVDVYCQVGYRASGGALRTHSRHDAALMFPELDGLNQDLQYVRYRCVAHVDPGTAELHATMVPL